MASFLKIQSCVLLFETFTFLYAIQCYKCGPNGQNCDNPTIVTCEAKIEKCKSWWLNGKIQVAKCYGGVGLDGCYIRGENGRQQVCTNVGESQPCNDPKLSACELSNITRCYKCDESTGQPCRKPVIESCSSGQNKCFTELKNNFGTKAGCYSGDKNTGCYENGDEAKLNVCTGPINQLCNNPGHLCAT